MGLTIETWKMLFNGVILPVIDDFVYYTENTNKLPKKAMAVYEDVAAIFISKIATILNQPPQNFLLFHYYQNI